MGGKSDLVKKALKVVGDYFSPDTVEHAKNLENFFGNTDPNLRRRLFTGTSKDKDFTAFQESRHGTWLTANPEEASDYAMQNDSQSLRMIPGTWKYEPVNSASRVIPTYARVENPYRGQLPDFARAENYKKAQSDWFDKLRAEGYDAWVPDDRNGDLVVVLKNQGTNVKSAIGNAGTFDTTKKHMNKADGGSVREGYAGRGRVVGDIVDQALKLVAGEGGEEAAKTGIRAYHGSPHDFAAESALRAFAETKLKTPKGKPMRLYHLTPGNFSEFSVSPENRSGPVVFLSPYADFQPAYHQAAERGPNDEITSIFKEGANVMPVYADVRNPLILDSNEKIKEAQAKYQSGDRGFPYFVKPEAKAAMEADGYDGIIFGGNNPAPYRSETFTEGWNPHIGFQQNREEEIIVFDPQKVKSAISNTGKYDFTNPDITKAGGGSTSGPQRSMDKNISILGAMNVARGIIGGK